MLILKKGEQSCMVGVWSIKLSITAVNSFTLLLRMRPCLAMTQHPNLRLDFPFFAVQMPALTAPICYPLNLPLANPCLSTLTDVSSLRLNDFVQWTEATA